MKENKSHLYQLLKKRRNYFFTMHLAKVNIKVKADKGRCYFAQILTRKITLHLGQINTESFTCTKVKSDMLFQQGRLFLRKKNCF